jgi:hypothetical protein
MNTALQTPAAQERPETGSGESPLRPEGVLGTAHRAGHRTPVTPGFREPSPGDGPRSGPGPGEVRARGGGVAVLASAGVFEGAGS